MNVIIFIIGFVFGVIAGAFVTKKLWFKRGWQACYYILLTELQKTLDEIKEMNLDDTSKSS